MAFMAVIMGLRLLFYILWGLGNSMSGGDGLRTHEPKHQFESFGFSWVVMVEGVTHLLL